MPMILRNTDILFNSNAVLASPPGTAPMFAARAWVNFNGTGTVAIRASGNVSSITDNGTGQYTVNFATAMPDANYAMGGSGTRTSISNQTAVIQFGGTPTTTSATINNVSGNDTRIDALFCMVEFFR